jgi:ribonucleoside-diphosphate reductase alpha chain
MRPQVIRGETSVIKVGCGKLYGTFSNKDEEYQEVFLRLGKCGGCALAFLDGIGRLISMGLNKPLTYKLIHKAFVGIRCPSPMFDGATQVLSCLDGIAKMIEAREGEDVNP